MQSRIISLLTLTWVTLYPLFGVAQDAPPTLDQRFISGLRERGLLELADAACRRQLESSQDQTDVWIGELLRVLAERAMNAESQDRAELWQEAEKLGDKFLRENEGHPRAIMIRVQLALNHFARGENLRIQSELRAAADVAPALAALADADRAFREIDQQLQLLIGRAGTKRDGRLTRDDLFALQNNVVYDRARVAQQRGLCYEMGSPDRAAAMGEAIEYLQDGLKRLDPGSSLTYQMRIERAACYRELQDLKTANVLLTPLLNLSADDELIPLLRCEQIRQAIARGDATTVQRSLTDQDSRLAGSVQWKLARLEGAVFLWQSNKDNPRLAQRWRNDALAILSAIENEHGGYWARRANRTLIRSATGSADVAVLQRAADEFYLRGQLDEAIAAYDKAAVAAVDSQDQDGQFLSMYRAARVVQQQDDPIAFRERLKKITVELPTHPRADDAHLVLIRELASAARQDQKFLEEYGAALAIHLTRWPEENTADQIRIWMGIWEGSRGNDENAILAYRAVDSKSEFFAEAVDGLRGIWLTRLVDAPAEIDDALAFLATANGGEWAAETATQQSIAAWSGTQLSLRFADDEVETWQPKLAVAWNNTDDARLKRRMMPTHVAALAQGGNVDEATAIVGAENDAEALLQVASQLAGLLERLSDKDKSQSTGKVLSRAIASLRKIPDASSESTLDHWEASAANASGDEAQAIAIYERLLAKTQADVGARRQLARLLTRSKDIKKMEEAIKQWRIVAGGFRKGDESWLEARYETAKLLKRLGKDEDAAKRVRLWLLTAKPKEPWKSRFEALLKP